MSDLHLRPRGVTELVDAAFTLYRQNPLPYIVVAAVLTAPAIALQILVPPVATTGGATIAAGIVQIISMLGHVLAGAVVTRAGSAAYLHGTLDVGAAVAQTVPRLPTVLMAALLKGLAYVIGALFFLVGALYVAARWFAVAQVVVLEDRGATDAFERSSDLSEGNKVHILKTLGLVWTVYIVVAIGAATAATPLNDVVAEVVIGLLAIVVYPVVTLTEVVLYYDARIRNEGFDVEHMVGTLDAPTPTPP